MSVPQIQNVPFGISKLSLVPKFFLLLTLGFRAEKVRKDFAEKKMTGVVRCPLSD